MDYVCGETCVFLQESAGLLGISIEILESMSEGIAAFDRDQRLSDLNVPD